MEDPEEFWSRGAAAEDPEDSGDSGPSEMFIMERSEGFRSSSGLFGKSLKLTYRQWNKSSCWKTFYSCKTAFLCWILSRQWQKVSWPLLLVFRNRKNLWKIYKKVVAGLWCCRCAGRTYHTPVFKGGKEFGKMSVIEVLPHQCIFFYPKITLFFVYFAALKQCFQTPCRRNPKTISKS